MRMHSGEKQMAMGTRRRRRRQERLWISHNELAKGPAHPFYKHVNELLEAEGFDEFAEKECAKFYAENNGRPSLTPGMYFRLLLVGYFEGIDSERGIAWRAADSIGLRKFLGVGLDEQTPDHSTISRTRRRLRDQGLVKGKTVGSAKPPGGPKGAVRSVGGGKKGGVKGNFQKGWAKKPEF